MAVFFEQDANRFKHEIAEQKLRDLLTTAGYTNGSGLGKIGIYPNENDFVDAVINYNGVRYAARVAFNFATAVIPADGYLDDVVAEVISTQFQADVTA